MSINNNQPKRNLFGDQSLWFLLLTNFVTIFFAIKENWNLTTLMSIYWFQNLAIGFFYFIRILEAKYIKEFSIRRFKKNDQSIQSTQVTKIFTQAAEIFMKIFSAFFFLFHYGFMHVFYMFFIFHLSVALTGEYKGIPNFMEDTYILLTTLLFFINHLFSYFYNKPRDTKKQSFSSLLTYPYVRIIPMHLTLMFGFFSTP